MYTQHGHHISGTPTDDVVRRVARCGGPGLCPTCSQEASSAQRAEGMFMGDPEPSPILRYFQFEHLPDTQRVISREFYGLAHRMEQTLPNGAEKATALRKLLESKDAAVRASLDI